MKYIMPYALLSVALVAATGCSSDDSDTPAASPAPETEKPGKANGETVNAAKLAEAVREKDAAIARSKAAEKKAADAEAALKTAQDEKASPEVIAELTRARDEALKAVESSKAELESLRAFESSALRSLEGSWMSFDAVIGDDCFQIVDVKGKAFQKVITCKKAGGEGYVAQVEKGILENLTVGEAGVVQADFNVKASSCVRNDSDKTVAVPFASESGSLLKASSLFGYTLKFAHPVSTKDTLLTRLDACESPFSLTAVACSYLREETPIEPNNELGCFVKESEPDFVRTKEIVALK